MSHFSQNSHFFKHQILCNFWIKNWFLPQCVGFEKKNGLENKQTAEIVAKYVNKQVQFGMKLR